mgnify:CR=1 FL=1
MTTEPTRKPRSFAGRGLCSECSTELTLIAGGLVIAHGPKGTRCPGGGRPPKAADALPLLSATTSDVEPAPSPVEAVEPAEAPEHLPPSAYRAGDRVERPSYRWVGVVDHVGPHHLTGQTVVTVAWDHGAATIHSDHSIAQIRRVEPVAPSMVVSVERETGAFVHTFTMGWPAVAPVVEVEVEVEPTPAAPVDALRDAIGDAPDEQPDTDWIDWEGRYRTCRTMLTGLLVAVGLDDPSEETAIVVDREVAIRAGRILADRVRQAIASTAGPSPAHRAIGEAEEPPAPSLTVLAEMSAELTEARAEIERLRRQLGDEAGMTDSAMREAQALRARNSDLRDALRHATALIGLIGRPS